MPKDTDKRVERSRRLLMDSLLELMAEKPYGKISVANICSHSGVARPTFYLHFHSKDDLLRGYIERMFLQFYAEVEPYLTATPDVDPLIAEIMFRQWSDNARFARLLVEADVEALMLSEFKRYVGKIMEGYIAAHANLMKDDGQVNYVIDFLTGASFMVIVRWIKEDFPISAKEMGALYADLVRPGLLQVLLKGAFNPAR
ncbi:TetR/AcrR family transcriptional regulator [Bacterioplanoides pacificum]|uniref:TetR/AcrR family transcriptional regulator n=1 Tax=Bacterioplanoides pacificum TaxID=1171596 RepID=A0ABV7VMW9_9GAMM